MILAGIVRIALVPSLDSERTQGVVGILTLGVLALTLVGILWYAAEAMRLRLAQEVEAQIQFHPWLNATDLRETPLQPRTESSPPRSRYSLHVRNVGATPAHHVQVQVKYYVVGATRQFVVNDQPEFELAPQDGFLVHLCELEFDRATQSASIQVEIRYRTAFGGAGELVIPFRYTSPRWSNLAMPPYRWWLSDGSVYPRAGKTGTFPRGPDR